MIEINAKERIWVNPKFITAVEAQEKTHYNREETAPYIWRIFVHMEDGKHWFTDEYKPTQRKKAQAFFSEIIDRVNKGKT